MECIEPGRVLVGPRRKDGDSSAIAERLSKEFGSDFQYQFGIDDILRQNDVKPPSLPLPFVGRVPEGAEEHIAARISDIAGDEVGAATPDYLVRPSAPITIDNTALKQAVQDIMAQPKSNSCGLGCVIGVLDSGIDPTVLPNATLHHRQYDALTPTAIGSTLADPNGHGSLVARIVSSVAPGATLLSVKTFDRTGTISSVIAALYLAHAAGPCDILNLSLSVSCAPVPCAFCHTPTPAAANVGQLAYFFQTFLQNAPHTVLVAAAGNNVQQLTLPADFNHVIAVGSFDYGLRQPISNYKQVPSNRFVLAPGGQSAPGKAFAQRPGFRQPEYLHGTSFAAAFVSGFAAKVVCSLKNSGCGQRQSSATKPTSLLTNVLQEIDSRTLKQWPGFSRSHHGLGAIIF
ncbi:MAG TPA: S8/S53 family peptidase [Xanthobacteraceae bacterium]|nr:S8/S53 family peptidase [Xanthobacteraceae bacterium]